MEYKYKLTNRDRKKNSKPGLFWCSTCDCYLVGNGQKCPNCGHVEGTKEKRPYKKQYTITDDE